MVKPVEDNSKINVGKKKQAEGEVVIRDSETSNALEALKNKEIDNKPKVVTSADIDEKIQESTNVDSTIERFLDIKQQDLYLEKTIIYPVSNKLDGTNTQIKIEQYRELSKKYTIVMWDVITRDYNQKLSPEKIFGIVKKYTRNGSIIVFHDSKKAQKNVLSTLPKALQFLKNEGFQFATLN